MSSAEQSRCPSRGKEGGSHPTSQRCFDWDAEDAAGGDSDGAERLTERTVHPARYDAENGCVLCEAPEIMRSKPGTVTIRVSVAVDGVNFEPSGGDVVYSISK